jgi:hypothetical protein
MHSDYAIDDGCDDNTTFLVVLAGFSRFVGPPFEDFAHRGLHALNVTVSTDHGVATIQEFGVITVLLPVVRIDFGILQQLENQIYLGPYHCIRHVAFPNVVWVISTSS